MKEIYVKVLVPDDIKFLAHQPWGSIMAFVNKPEIYKEGDEEYWNLQDGEIELSDLGEKMENWKDSIKEI